MGSDTPGCLPVWARPTCDGSVVVEEIYCAVCGDEALFEQPPCVDGHDSDCPDWVCVACGTAVFGGVLPAAELAAAAAPGAAA